MTTVKMTWNQKQVDEYIAKYSKDLNLKDPAKNYAIDVLRQAQRDAPIDTGALKASLQRGGPENIWQATYGSNRFKLQFGSDVYYAWYQERGVWYNHPRGGKSPYFFPKGVDMLPMLIIELLYMIAIHFS